jgi:phenylalanyl-tRNA synthetase alpha subunit
MKFENKEVAAAAASLKKQFEQAEDKRQVLRAPALTALYDRIKTLPAGEARAKFGQEVNTLKAELEQMVRGASQPKVEIKPIDVTAPFDINTPADQRPSLLPMELGSKHPVMADGLFGRRVA